MKISSFTLIEYVDIKFHHFFPVMLANFELPPLIGHVTFPHLWDWGLEILQWDGQPSKLLQAK
jgi:hypothetical protein